MAILDMPIDVRTRRLQLRPPAKAMPIRYARCSPIGR
jgi:hypothetical protein